MTLAIILFVVGLLTGCAPGGSGGGSAAVEAPVIVEPAPPSQPGDTPVQVRYYKRTITEAPIGSWPSKTYTASGMCLNYQGKDYCWDDGMKMVTIPAAGTFNYNYWQRTDPTYSNCYGGCVTAPLSVPTVISPAMQMNLTQAKINQVFQSGTPIDANCAETPAHQLVCTAFTINLNQVGF